MTKILFSREKSEVKNKRKALIRRQR